MRGTLPLCLCAALLALACRSDASSAAPAFRSVSPSDVLVSCPPGVPAPLLTRDGSGNLVGNTAGGSPNAAASGSPTQTRSVQYTDAGDANDLGCAGTEYTHLTRPSIVLLAERNLLASMAAVLSTALPHIRGAISSFIGASNRSSLSSLSPSTASAQSSSGDGSIGVAAEISKDARAQASASASAAADGGSPSAGASEQAAMSASGSKSIGISGQVNATLSGSRSADMSGQVIASVSGSKSIGVDGQVNVSVSGYKSADMNGQVNVSVSGSKSVKADGKISSNASSALSALQAGQNSATLSQSDSVNSAAQSLSALSGTASTGSSATLISTSADTGQSSGAGSKCSQSSTKPTDQPDKTEASSSGLQKDECTRDDYCSAPTPDRAADGLPAEDGPLSLVHVSAVARHGDRTPVLRLASDDADGAHPRWSAMVDRRKLFDLFPGLEKCTSPAKDAPPASQSSGVCAVFPPDRRASSAGMLTARGWSQMEEVGRALRRVYASRLFPGGVEAADVSVWSTPVARTVLSAAAIVEGLGLSAAPWGRPGGVPISVLPWTLSGSSDSRPAWYAEECPRVAKVQKQILGQSARWRETRRQIGRLASALGDRVVLRTTLRDAARKHRSSAPATAFSAGGWLRSDGEARLLMHVADALRARACHGVLRPPADFADALPDVGPRLCALSRQAHAIFASELRDSPEALRLAAGGLVRDLFRGWAGGRLPRLSVLSAHDSTLAVLLAVLSPSNSAPWPGYASTLLFELWRGPRVPLDSADADAAGSFRPSNGANDSEGDDDEDRDGHYYYVRAVLNGSALELPWCADKVQGAEELRRFCPLHVFLRHIGSVESPDRLSDCRAE